MLENDLLHDRTILIRQAERGFVEDIRSEEEVEEKEVKKVEVEEGEGGIQSFALNGQKREGWSQHSQKEVQGGERDNISSDWSIDENPFF